MRVCPWGMETKLQFDLKKTKERIVQTNYTSYGSMTTPHNI